MKKSEVFYHGFEIVSKDSIVKIHFFRFLKLTKSSTPSELKPQHQRILAGFRHKIKLLKYPKNTLALYMLSVNTSEFCYEFKCLFKQELSGDRVDCV